VQKQIQQVRQVALYIVLFMQLVLTVRFQRLLYFACACLNVFKLRNIWPSMNDAA